MCAGKRIFMCVAAAASIAALIALPAAVAQSRIPRVFQMNPNFSVSYLGIQMEDVTASNMSAHKLTTERGVIVSSVEKGSPAETAGLQPHDVILEYSGLPVISAMQFSRLIGETPAGRTAELAISRDGRKMNISAKLAERDDRPRSAGRDFSNFPQWFEFRNPGGRTFQFRVPDDGASKVLPRSEEKPRLGVTLQPLTEQMAEFLGVPVKGKTGILVTSVESGSPAASKLKAGDVILKADGKAVDNAEELTTIVQRADRKLELVIYRGGKELTVSIELPPSKGYKL
jgi:serine protease Do